MLVDVVQACSCRRLAEQVFACVILFSVVRKNARAAVLRKKSRVLPHRGPLAQLDRATDYESVGREFESLRARH